MNENQSILNHDEVIMRVRFAKNVLFFQLFVITIVLLIYNMLDKNHYGQFFFSTFLIFFILVPFLIRYIFHLTRVFTQQITVTHEHVVIKKGLIFKQTIKISLDELYGILVKRNMIDQRLNVLSVKLITVEGKSYYIKKIGNGKEFINYIRDHILKNQERIDQEKQAESQTEDQN